MYGLVAFSAKPDYMGTTSSEYAKKILILRYTHQTFMNLLVEENYDCLVIISKLDTKFIELFLLHTEGILV